MALDFLSFKDLETERNWLRSIGGEGFLGLDIPRLRRVGMVILMQTLTHLLVLAFVVSTMLGVGLMLTVRDISVSLHDRRWLVRALLANFVVLPTIALGVSRLMELDPVLTASLLVLATAPGGPVLVKLVTVVKGDPALAVGLVVILLLVGSRLNPSY